MERKVQANRSSVLIYSAIVFVGVILVVLVLTNATTFSALGLKRSSVALVERPPKSIPVVESYYGKNWDYRARNGDEQVLVIGNSGESFEKMLFRISCSLALCAHMGYAPPLIIVETNRVSDSPSSAKDVPELIQDIFPKLRVLGVSSPVSFVKTNFPNAMQIQGSTQRDSHGSFAEFPPIKTSTVVITGDWESWKYTEDYKQVIFDHLEFHPMLYHYSRKTYPVLYDRKSPARGIVLGGILGDGMGDEVREFLTRNRFPNEKIVVFTEKPVENPELFGEGALIVQGECPQVIIYASVFCRELLIDSSLLGWWAGMHAYYRGREVYYMSSDEGEHFLSPHWTQNKKKE